MVKSPSKRRDSEKNKTFYEAIPTPVLLILSKELSLTAENYFLNVIILRWGDSC
jgi:hypothetical protein